VRVVLLALAVLALSAPACSPKMSYQAMAAQPRYEPYEASTFFVDGSSARPLVPGTVPRGSAAGQAPTGNGAAADAFPFPITAAVMARGRERFNIYCAPCHDQAGTGTGIVVRRGFTPPPSLHSERLRAAPAGYLYEVITNGFGAMPSYAAQVPERDRWAIVAYVRALQLSQNARPEDVPDTERQQLESQGQAP
jgi:mono/diheme cytochrome c family protein